MNVVLKKKWGKPVTDVQVFVPQEYCGSCWTVSLTCEANNYIKLSSGTKYSRHSGHSKAHSKDYIVHSSSENQPTNQEIINQLEIDYPATTFLSANGSSTRNGYAWNDNGWFWSPNPPSVGNRASDANAS